MDVSVVFNQTVLVSSFACFIHFKLPTDMHASLKIMHAGGLSDEVAGMTDLAFAFIHNTLRWRRFLLTPLMSVQHLILQTLCIDAICFKVTINSPRTTRLSFQLVPKSEIWSFNTFLSLVKLARDEDLYIYIYT